MNPTMDMKKRHVLTKIRLHAQSLLIILSSTMNIIGGDFYDHILRTTIVTSTTKKILI